MCSKGPPFMYHGNHVMVK